MIKDQSFDDLDFEDMSDEEWLDYCEKAYRLNPNGNDELDAYVDALNECILGDSDVMKWKTDVESIYQLYPDMENVNELMSSLLVNLSYEQDETEIETILQSLSMIYGRFSKNSLIANDYAAAIENQIDVSNYEKAVELLTLLKSIKDAFPKEKDIKEVYKRSSETVKQKKKALKYQKAADDSKERFNKEQSEETALIYAKSLSDLADVTENESDAYKVMLKLKALRETYPSNSMTLYYANSISSLCLCQDFDEAVETRSALLKLSDDNEIEEAIKELYAHTTAELTVMNDHSISSLVKELELLNTEYPSNETIAESYALGLYCLSDSIMIADIDEKRLEVLELLRLLSRKYKKNQEIKEYYQDALEIYKFDKEN